MRSPPRSRARGCSRGGRPRPPWGPGRRSRSLEHPWGALLSGEVRYAARELVEVEARLRADRGLQEGPDAPDLDLKLAQELRGPALDPDHVAQDSGLGLAGYQRVGDALHVDQRAASAAAILLARNQGANTVGTH